MTWLGLTVLPQGETGSLVERRLPIPASPLLDPSTHLEVDHLLSASMHSLMHVLVIIWKSHIIVFIRLYALHVKLYLLTVILVLLQLLIEID